MNSRILITGSRGFIGSHLTKEMKRLGNAVFELPKSNNLDLTNFSNLKEIPPQDAVYHLAGVTGTGDSLSNPLKTYHVNVTGTLNILEWCRLNDVERLIYSSSYVYGTPKYLPVDEKHPVNPGNPYSRSKFLGENLCSGYHEDYGMNIVILRFFNVYGFGQNEAFLIPSVIKQCFSGKVKVKDPLPKRDFIYIEDVVSACLKADNPDISYDIFNIGYGVSYSVYETVNLIKDIFQSMTEAKVEVQYINEKKKYEIVNTVADISKAKKLLGWEPRIDFSTGLEKTVRGFLGELEK